MTREYSTVRGVPGRLGTDRYRAEMHRSRRRLGLLVVVALVAVGIAFVTTSRDGGVPGRGVAAALRAAAATVPAVRDLVPYTGSGAWVDAFDYGPTYQKAGAPPPLTPAVVDDLAAHGVRTLFLQATRRDAPDGLVDRALEAEFLLRAHRAGLKVVGWYLPTFADPATDLEHLEQISDFDVLGHRFDGVAVDIEDVDTVTDLADRNARLVELSDRFRAASGTEAIGAIVLPPVLTEVVNPRRWPDFPWGAISGDYDVWLPMSYWTFRTSASGYRDGYTYSDESTRRLRADLEDPSAPVHAIGGIGDELTGEDLARFRASVLDDHAIGASIYDWNSMTPARRDQFAQSMAELSPDLAPPPPLRR